MKTSKKTLCKKKIKDPQIGKNKLSYKLVRMNIDKLLIEAAIIDMQIYFNHIPHNRIALNYYKIYLLNLSSWHGDFNYKLMLIHLMFMYFGFFYGDNKILVAVT